MVLADFIIIFICYMFAIYEGQNIFLKIIIYLKYILKNIQEWPQIILAENIFTYMYFKTYFSKYICWPFWYILN